MIELTVVIPAYNAQRWIDRTISSVARQVPTPRIIVIDDGSDDNTPSIVADFGTAVELVRQQNAGQGRARNRGLEMTTSPYVMFLDADDWVEGDFVGGALSALKMADADVAFAPFILQQADGFRRRLFHYDPIPTPETIFCNWPTQYSQPPCCIVWRTAFVRAIGGWNETRAMKNDDGEFTMRAMLSRPTITSFNLGSGIYNAHEDPSVSKTLSSSQIRADLFGINELIRKARGTSFEAGLSGLGLYLYTLARAAFQIGDVALGREALACARSVGQSNHPGTRLHRVAAGLFGLERKMSIANTLRALVNRLQKSPWVTRKGRIQ